MNTKNIKEFKLFEGDTFVAKFSKLSISVSSDIEDPSKVQMAYIAEDLKLEDEFHFMNDESNKYSIKFSGCSKEKDITYTLKNCVIDSRTPIKDDIYTLDRIEGVFETVLADKN